MNPKNILYIIGISGVITFLVGALYMFRTVGLDGSMNVWQLGFSLFIISPHTKHFMLLCP